MKCTKCNNDTFTITESLSWKAYYDEEDNCLVAHNTNSVIDGVYCKKCNYDMTQEFEESGIDINWQ